jgi:hypothetical protein
MALEVERLRSSPLASRMLDLKRMASLIENWPNTDFESNDVAGSHHIALTWGLSTGRFLMQYDPDKTARS